MPENPLKTCTHCGKEKSVEDFYKKTPERHMAHCKLCHKEMIRIHNEKNPEKHKECVKQWQKKNKEHVLKKQNDWRKKNAESVRERDRERARSMEAREKKRAYRREAKEHIKNKNAEYREENKDKINDYNAMYRLQNKEILKARHKLWRLTNPVDDRANRSRWKKANKIKVNAHTHKRRVLLAGTVGENYTIEQLEALRQAQDYTCLCCGFREPAIQLTVDHIKPISKNGTNDILNIQLLCKSCNCAKHNKEIDYRPEFMKPTAVPEPREELPPPAE